ncbi:prephenate dehydrogenase [Aminiphilus circumscriptus]|jgi:prephenate dehydrogenase|uniref:prephenate dehydrogenase n=1 Tax=Aminiphilus circumscriptus TaxID=290732 RepID=UPI00047864AF|nr:prephenate dehydrogenase/arogenate dehydrogenase family protein [Aminiphilus circumscriptus]
MRMKQAHVGILGLGLLGGSLALRLGGSGGVRRVSGWDADPAVRAEAARKGIAHVPEHLEDMLCGVDVLIFAVPMRSLEEANRRVLGALRRNAGIGFSEWPDLAPMEPLEGPRVVMDLSSAKVEPGELLRGAWRSRYVGFHPMAGKENGGIANATPDLFEGACCAVVPFAETSEEALAVAEELALLLGAGAVRIDPAEHDAIVATVSHLPLLTAAAMVLTAKAEGKSHAALAALAAGGFRDATRVASGPAWLGTDMVDANGDQIRRVAERFIASLKEMLALPKKELEALLAEAANARDGLVTVVHKGRAA